MNESFFARPASSSAPKLDSKSDSQSEKSTEACSSDSETSGPSQFSTGLTAFGSPVPDSCFAEESSRDVPRGLADLTETQWETSDEMKLCGEGSESSASSEECWRRFDKIGFGRK
jgi:hypothetical protein